jgi:hypothetical protein
LGNLAIIKRSNRFAPFRRRKANAQVSTGYPQVFPRLARFSHLDGLRNRYFVVRAKKSPQKLLWTDFVRRGPCEASGAIDGTARKAAAETEAGRRRRESIRACGADARRRHDAAKGAVTGVRLGPSARR